MLMYIGALLMDMMCFLVGFAVLYGAGERHMTQAQCAWLGAAMQLTYMPFSFLVGYVLSRRNARALLFIGTVGAMGVGVSALFCTGFKAIFILLLFFGMFGAFFFNSFQTYMRSETPPGGLHRAVANYTLAWSVGIGLGFCLSGSAYRLGPAGLAAMAAAAGLAILAIVFLREARPHDEASADEHVEQGPEGSRPVASRYVIIGWIMIFAACFVQRPIQTFFPALCAQEKISPYLASLPLFLMMFIQAGAGFAMTWFRAILYRRTALWVIQLGGAAALAIIWKFPAYPSFLVGICFAVVGIYLGFVFFCAVYYASNDFAHRSRNVGVNEFLVGAGSLAGIFVCEAWMRHGTQGAQQALNGIHPGQAAPLYAVCAAALVIFTAAQVIIASIGGAGRK